MTDRSELLDPVVVAAEAQGARAYARRVSAASRSVVRGLADTSNRLARTFDATAAVLEQGAGNLTDEGSRRLLERARQARERAVLERVRANRPRQGHDPEVL